MKKFIFTLEKMHRYKEQILERERLALMQANVNRQRCEDALRSCEEQLIQLNREMQTATRKGISAQELMRFRFFDENLHRQIKELKKELWTLTEQAERQRKTVVTASQEVSELDKLEEKQLEAYSYLEHKEQENLISEIVSSNLIRQAHP